MSSTEENRTIVTAAKLDPDAKPLTARQLKSMVPLKAVRGRPKLAIKRQLVSVRFSPEVLAYLWDTGEGGQASMDGVVRDDVANLGRSDGRISTSNSLSSPRLPHREIGRVE